MWTTFILKQCHLVILQTFLLCRRHMRYRSVRRRHRFIEHSAHPIYLNERFQQQRLRGATQRRILLCHIQNERNLFRVFASINALLINKLFLPQSMNGNLSLHHRIKRRLNQLKQDHTQTVDISRGAIHSSCACRATTICNLFRRSVAYSASVHRQIRARVMHKMRPIVNMRGWSRCRSRRMVDYDKRVGNTFAQPKIANLDRRWHSRHC
mmetsp:Transcript_48573/g.80534  ORF Transcript_48573/g.80534 Transcript_48573/m.80534 type:complete len:210 (+) Transcript_48573:348-977(+)